MAEYRRNLRGMLTKNGLARPEEILSLNGPAKIRARPARPDLSRLRFTTLITIIEK